MLNTLTMMTKVVIRFHHYFKFTNDDRFVSKMDLSEDEQKLLNEISDNLNLLNKDNVLSKMLSPLRNFLTSDKYKNLIETSND